MLPSVDLPDPTPGAVHGVGEVGAQRQMQIVDDLTTKVEVRP